MHDRWYNQNGTPAWNNHPCAIQNKFQKKYHQLNDPTAGNTCTNQPMKPRACPKRSQSILRASPERPQNVPEPPQNVPRTPPERSQSVPRRPRASPERPRASPVRPRAFPERPQSVPRASQSIPERPRASPEHPQSVPRTCQNIPRASQSVPLRPKALARGFRSDFRAIFASCAAWPTCISTAPGAVETHFTHFASCLRVGTPGRPLGAPWEAVGDALGSL